MRADEIVTFLIKAGSSKIKVGPTWVMATCPVAHLRHAHGRDETPSFAVHIEPDGESRCRCHSCGYAGPLYPLSWLLDKPELLDLANVNNQAEWGDEPLGLQESVAKMAGAYWGETRKPVDVLEALREKNKNEPIDEDLLHEFQPMPDWVQRYLQDRGLYETTVEAWELGYHRATDRLSIPIRGGDGSLVAVSGRSLGKRMPKYLHSQFRRNLILYGHHLAEKGGTAYLCEGFFQAIAIWQLDFRSPLARMGTHLSKEQEQIIVEQFDELVVVPDGDKAGVKSAEEIAKRLSSRIPVKIANMPGGFDADTLQDHVLKKVLNEARAVQTDEPRFALR